MYAKHYGKAIEIKQDWEKTQSLYRHFSEDSIAIS